VEKGSTAVIEKPGVTDGTKKDSFFGWRTVLFNCNCHSFDQVEWQLIKAIRCSPEKAHQYALAVHTKGKVEVYEGYKEKAEAIADVLGTIGLRVTVSQ